MQKKKTKKHDSCKNEKNVNEINPRAVSEIYTEKCIFNCISVLYFVHVRRAFVSIRFDCVLYACSLISNGHSTKITRKKHKNRF